MSQKIFYVQVIEAREVVSRFPGAVVTPGVVVKYNGGNKKSTGYKASKTYWAEIFTFPVDNVHTDTVLFQLREKGFHVVSSDWIGEIKLKLSDFDDGNVHLKWFRLGSGEGKQHSKAPKGVLLLKIHLTTKSDKPFYKKPAERQLSYDEWIEWSESQYANSHSSGIKPESYPTNGALPRSRSGSLSATNEQAKKDDKNRSQSVSTYGRPITNGKKLNKSAEDANSDGEISDRSSSSQSPPGSLRREDSTNSTGSEKVQTRFPISPLATSPPQPAQNKKLQQDLLIDLSTPEIGKPTPSFVSAAPSTNPFSADVMSLANTFQNSSLNTTPEKMMTGNPFLDPTPEVSRVSRVHESY